MDIASICSEGTVSSFEPCDREGQKAATFIFSVDAAVAFGANGRTRLSNIAGVVEELGVALREGVAVVLVVCGVAPFQMERRSSATHLATPPNVLPLYHTMCRATGVPFTEISVNREELKITAGKDALLSCIQNVLLTGGVPILHESEAVFGHSESTATDVLAAQIAKLIPHCTLVTLLEGRGLCTSWAGSAETKVLSTYGGEVEIFGLNSQVKASTALRLSSEGTHRLIVCGTAERDVIRRLRHHEPIGTTVVAETSRGTVEKGPVVQRRAPILTSKEPCNSVAEPPTEIGRSRVALLKQLFQS